MGQVLGVVFLLLAGGGSGACVVAITDRRAATAEIRRVLGQPPPRDPPRWPSGRPYEPAAPLFDDPRPGPGDRR